MSRKRTLRLTLSSLLICLFLCSTCFKSSAKNKSFDKLLYEAIRSNDYNRTTELLEWHFRSNGLSISERLYWNQASPFALYNYYNNNAKRPVISVSRYPTKYQLSTYWKTWSKHLTQSNWDPDSFFKNQKDAMTMAQYNILMLLSHELGHHLAHRHNIKMEPLNCHEYLADMASMSVVASFPEKSKMATLQNRYLELMASINNAIPASDRFDVQELDIHANCECVPVEYPRDSSQMSQYASAYFVRRLMLANNPRFKTSEAICDSIFKKFQLGWENKYPRLSAQIIGYEVAEDRTRMGDAGSSIYDIYAIQMWGAERIHRVNSSGYTDSGELYTVQLNWPEKMVKDGLQNVRILNQNGSHYFDWHYYPDTTEVVEYLTFMGFVGTDVRKDFSFLTYEEDVSGNGHYCLYSQSRGYLLKKEILHIEEVLHKDGDCQLFSVDKGSIVIYANGNHAFTKTSYNRDLRIYNTETLFQLGLTYDKEDIFEDRLITSTKDGNIFFYSDNYVMLWDGKSISTVVGSGVKGVNFVDQLNGINEFENIQAIHFDKGVLTVYDEEFFTNADWNPIHIWKFKIDLPIAN